MELGEDAVERTVFALLLRGLLRHEELFLEALDLSRAGA